MSFKCNFSHLKYFLQLAAKIVVAVAARTVSSESPKFFVFDDCSSLGDHSPNSLSATTWLEWTLFFLILLWQHKHYRHAKSNKM